LALRRGWDATPAAEFPELLSRGAGRARAPRDEPRKATNHGVHRVALHPSSATV